MHAHWLARTARFWNSLVAAPEDSLMRQVLDASLQLAADHTPSRHRGPHGIAQMPWAAQLQSALAEAGIAADLQQRQPLQPEAVQEAALQHYLQHLNTAVQRRGASRLQHYFDCVRPECLVLCPRVLSRPASFSAAWLVLCLPSTLNPAPRLLCTHSAEAPHTL